MPDKPQPDPTPTAWDGFGATLIHDVGKVGELTTLAERSRRKGHELSHAKDLLFMLNGCFEEHSIPGVPLVPAAWYDFIESAGGGATETIHLAHKLADRISKQMQGEYYNRLEDKTWLAELEKTDNAARE